MHMGHFLNAKRNQPISIEMLPSGGRKVLKNLLDVNALWYNGNEKRAIAVWKKTHERTIDN